MATAAVQNLIQEAHANVHACVRHNVISSFESMTLFYSLIAFSSVDGNTILEALKKALNMLTAFDRTGRDNGMNRAMVEMCPPGEIWQYCFYCRRYSCDSRVILRIAGKRGLDKLQIQSRRNY